MSIEPTVAGSSVDVCPVTSFVEDHSGVVVSVSFVDVSVFDDVSSEEEVDVSGDVSTAAFL